MQEVQDLGSRDQSLQGEGENYWEVILICTSLLDEKAEVREEQIRGYCLCGRKQRMGVWSARARDNAW